MKFNCSKTELAAAVSNVQRAVSSKSSMASLEGILIKAYNNEIELTGYDMELGMRTKIEASIKEEGEIVVSAKLFSEIIRKLPEEIVVIETDDKMIIYVTSGLADYQIIGIPTNDYPELPSFDVTDRIKIKGEILKNMIRQTIFAVSDNTTKPIYTGSLFDINGKDFKIVSVDGFKMAVRQENIESECNTKFVVPKKTLSEIIKLITKEDDDVEIILGQRHIVFNIEDYYLISRLIEGNFLDYNSAVPKTEKTKFNISTSVLVNALERIDLLVDERIQSPIKLLVSMDEIKLSCSTARGKASDSLSVTIAGEDVEIGFNGRYLIETLKNTDTDCVKIILNGSLSPMVIRPVDGDSFTFIVVPMRISRDM